MSAACFVCHTTDDVLIVHGLYSQTGDFTVSHQLPEPRSMCRDCLRAALHQRMEDARWWEEQS